jgi:transcriptional regulator with XRE-family HTH domain
MEEAPNRIRELRLAAGLSQQAIADRINVSKVTISDLERGKMRLDVEYMRRIADALGCLPADLLPAKDNPWSLSEEERLLIDRYRQADHAAQEQLQRVAGVLLPFHHETDSEAA